MCQSGPRLHHWCNSLASGDHVSGVISGPLCQPLTGNAPLSSSGNNSQTYGHASYLIDLCFA